MTEWKVVGPDARYLPLVTVWMVWGYWPDDDVVELHGAVDEYTDEVNDALLAGMLSDARSRFGAENVRLAKVAVPWTPITDMFDPAKVEADLPVAIPREETPGV